jgi:hypothetical protein
VRALASPWPDRFRELSSALRRGLDWRLLLLWLVGMLIPTLLLALPIWRMLAAALDAYPLSGQIAQRFDMLAFEDLTLPVQRSGPALAGAAIMALISALLISPLLTAAVLAVAADGELAGESTLLQRAIAWYGRAFRIWLLSLVPMAVAVLVFWGASKGIESYAERATLESRVDLGSRLAMTGAGCFALLLHGSVEAARAELAATPESRSVCLAWLRGVRKALRRPLPTLAFYLIPTLASLLLAALLSVLRLNLVASSRMGFCVGALLTQLAVAAMGWGRVSRVFALTLLFRRVRARD